MSRLSLQRLTRALLVGMIVLLQGCGDDIPVMSSVPGNAVVLAFGDSLTFGTGANTQTTSYPAVLASLIGRQVVNAGVPGEVSADGLARFPELLEEHTPTLVILCHGGNDMLRKQDLSATKANLRAMITLAKASGAQVLFVGVPRPGLVLKTAKHYDELAEELKLPYLRDTFAEILGDRNLKSDAAHPNAAGYKQFADAAATYLREAKAIN